MRAFLDKWLKDLVKESGERLHCISIMRLNVALIVLLPVLAMTIRQSKIKFYSISQKRKKKSANCILIWKCTKTRLFAWWIDLKMHSIMQYINVMKLYQFFFVLLPAIGKHQRIMSKNGKSLRHRWRENGWNRSCHRQVSAGITNPDITESEL